MTSDGGQPPKPKESAQGTLLGFPQQTEPESSAPRSPAPPTNPPPVGKRPLPPPRGHREPAPMPPLRGRPTQPPPDAIPPSGAHPAPAAPATTPTPAPYDPRSKPATIPPAERPKSSTIPPIVERSKPSTLAGVPQPIGTAPTVPTAPTAIPTPHSGQFSAHSAPSSAAIPTTVPGPHSGPTGPHSGPQSGAGTQPELGAPITTPPAAVPDPYHSGPVGAPPQHESRPHAGPREWGGVAAVLIENPGTKFVNFLKISAKRAFRLRIEASEVLPSEREVLERAVPPIVDKNLQAFLAWRRSVLFVVACALIPLFLFGFGDALLVGQATPIRVIKMAPVIAEGIFLAICWLALRDWQHWRKQRRLLFLGWLLFVATPFVVFLYPVRSVFTTATPTLEDLRALSIPAITARLTTFTDDLLRFKIAMVAMLQLAPKAISMMPGLVRASLVIKLLFPGSPAPGWLIVVAAPLYALLAYVILIVPYQFTGSGWFVFGVIGIVAAQIHLARSGFALAQPLTDEEALVAITKVRKLYVTMMIVSAVLIVIALSSLVVRLNMPWTDVVLSVLKFETNVLILTLIGSDVVIKNLDRARQQTVGREHVEELGELKIAAFVSLDAPHVPPPSGPAPSTDLWNKP
ncbi:MAG: hypothetical protein ABI867_10735 [Kofleriaceae bacterium]